MDKFDHTSGNYLAVDGAKIYYEIKGNPAGFPLLMLHGGLGTIADYNDVLPALAKKFKIIGIDSRGQGKSTLGQVTLSYARLQQDVEQVLAHLNIDTLNIIGFSDGGITAYRLAALKQLTVKKLVTIGADWQLENGDSIFSVYAKVTSEGWKKKFPESFQTYHDLNPEPEFDSLVKNILGMWQDQTVDGYPGENIRAISASVLLVRGDADIFLTREDAIELANQLDEAALFNIPFASHMAFADRKDLFVLGVTQFLNN